jgi:ABC-type multidrug transport system fused ATPase/permease subunit
LPACRSAGGAVRIGGHDLRALDPDAVRRMIAVVAQDTYLFHGSIEDNLRLGCPDASEADLVAVARVTHDFIRGAARRLPDGDRRACAASGGSANASRSPAPAARRADPGAGRGAVGGRGE